MQKPDQVWLQKSDKTVTTTAWATARPPGCHSHCSVPSGPGPWEAGVALQSPPWRAGHSLLGAGGSVGQGMSAPCRFCSSSQEYQSAQASLTRSFQGKFDKFVVPCVVASGDTKDRKGTEPLSFRCSALGRGAGWSSPCQQPPRSRWGWLRVWLGGQGTWSLPCPQQIPAVPSPHNTLYLELWCPAVAPSIVVTSDKGKTIINFGDIAAGVS